MTDNRWSSLPDAERHWNVGKGLDKAPPDLDLDLDGNGDDTQRLKMMIQFG